MQNNSHPNGISANQSQSNEDNTLQALRYWSNSYKAKCIDFYLKRANCQVIGNEFRYGTGQLITDLVLLTPRNTISIEIKTAQDDLRRLPKQVIEASKVFTQTIVFISSEHKCNALKMLPNTVGIIVVSSKGCAVIRTPRRLNPEPMEVLASIPSSFLRRYFKIAENMHSDDLRIHVLQGYSSKINICFRHYLIEKYEQNFAQFLSDRGTQTHVEDIGILNMKSQIELR